MLVDMIFEWKNKRLWYLAINSFKSLSIDYAKCNGCSWWAQESSLEKFVSVVQVITMEVEELRESGNEDDNSVVKTQFFFLYDKQLGHTAYVF